MIVSASYRTDIPAFYGAWFLERLHAGWVRTASPYGGKPAHLPLTRETVDGFVFWTRNAGPFLPALEAVGAVPFPFVVQYTITGYPKPLDAATPDPRRGCDWLQRLASRYGAAAAVWRYDPIVFTSLTPPAWHAGTFHSLARSLRGAVDEVVVSFAQIYRKTARNMNAAARAFGFHWWDPPSDQKRALLTDLAAIAAECGLAITLCGQRELLVPGVGDARCIDAERLSRVAGRPIGALRRPHRKTCGCWASRDIGDYDSCIQGCAYCYAVNGRAAAKDRLERHDPAGPSLIPPRSTPAPACVEGALPRPPDQNFSSSWTPDASPRGSPCRS
ncbi:MAG: DUF1848 domain-containing protein [Rhodospirillales bacterium]